MTVNMEAGRVPQWSLGDRLRKARESAGLNQAELAERLGVARMTVSRSESGSTEPMRVVVRAWALATGVPLMWLETGEAPAPGGDGASSESLLSESNRRPFHYESHGGNLLHLPAAG